MKNILTSFAIVVSMLGIGAGAAVVSPLNVQTAGAVNNGLNEGLRATGGTGGKANNLKQNITLVTNILLFILGAVAVIMIILGGIRFTIANGDQSQVKSARDTILYAVVGLVVAILAYAIVQFVIDKLAA